MRRADACPPRPPWIALRNDVVRLLGTDLDPAPLETAQRNLEAARLHYAEALTGTSAALIACDFREAPNRLAEVRDGHVSLIIPHHQVT